MVCPAQVEGGIDDVSSITCITLPPLQGAQEGVDVASTCSLPRSAGEGRGGGHARAAGRCFLARRVLTAVASGSDSTASKFSPKNRKYGLP